MDVDPPTMLHLSPATTQVDSCRSPPNFVGIMARITLDVELSSGRASGCRKLVGKWAVLFCLQCFAGNSNYFFGAGKCQRRRGSLVRQRGVRTPAWSLGCGELLLACTSIISFSRYSWLFLSDPDLLDKGRLGLLESRQQRRDRDWLQQGWLGKRQ